VLPLALLAVALAGCPHDASLGSIAYVRGNASHRLSLADCTDRVTGRAPAVQRNPPLLSPDRRFAASVRATGSARTAKQTIWITNVRTRRARPIFSETQYHRTIGPSETPGPIWLLGWSGDDRWVFFTIDPGSSASIAADGLTLRVVSTNGGAAHRLGIMLAYRDYLAWCGGRLVFTAGPDRIATDAKRLVVAAPPDWQPHALWNDPSRTFGSLACAPDGRSLAVLNQRSSTNASFFSTRWQLWRVGLDGSRTLLDRPPAGFADESPRWSRDGRALLFVRERQGHGTLDLWRDGRLFGPIASLGYSLGFYGHHDWPFAWAR
jgi:WD40-like Beta Propeller Repeat